MLCSTSYGTIKKRWPIVEDESNLLMSVCFTMRKDNAWHSTLIRPTVRSPSVRPFVLLSLCLLCLSRTSNNMLISKWRWSCTYTSCNFGSCFFVLCSSTRPYFCLFFGVDGSIIDDSTQRRDQSSGPVRNLKIANGMVMYRVHILTIFGV